MSGPPPAPPASRKGRWPAVAFILALAGFTFLCWRDAGRPPVRPVGGGTFVGRDVDGRLVQVCLFEQTAGWHDEKGWQGWLYREGLLQTVWFTTTNRAHSWRETVNVREREDAPKPPDALVASTDDPLQLNATLPRTNGWTSDTANLTRRFEHLSFRRRVGLKVGRFGGTKEFHAQFPQLPPGVPFYDALAAGMVQRFEKAAGEFTRGIYAHWKEAYELGWPVTMSEWRLIETWQARLVEPKLVSFCVFSHDETGGNGNHSRWSGENYIATHGGYRHLKLAELFREEFDWQAELRTRCVSKLTTIPAPRPAAVLDKAVGIEVFTLSSTGLQIYFNPYAIASGADGEFVVHFDYAELKDLLRDDGPAQWLPRGK